MGSMISLGLGQLEVDWGKNNFFTNHSKLFLKGDIAPAIYYYAEGREESQPAFVRRKPTSVRAKTAECDKATVKGTSA
jgi:hypothetical protein